MLINYNYMKEINCVSETKQYEANNNCGWQMILYFVFSIVHSLGSAKSHILTPQE